MDSITNGKYDAIVIGIHDFTLRPANNYGISAYRNAIVESIAVNESSHACFWKCLATKNFCNAKDLVACYQDDDITQQVAADLLEGNISTEGTLPVSVCEFKYGAGIMQKAVTPQLTMEQDKFRTVDSIAEDAIAKKAFPGCVILAAHNGEIVYHKAFGNYEYGPSPAMNFGKYF